MSLSKIRKGILMKMKIYNGPFKPFSIHKEYKELFYLSEQSSEINVNQLNFFLLLS